MLASGRYVPFMGGRSLLRLLFFCVIVTYCYREVFTHSFGLGGAPFIIVSSLGGWMMLKVVESCRVQTQIDYVRAQSLLSRFLFLRC